MEPTVKLLVFLFLIFFFFSLALGDHKGKVDAMAVEGWIAVVPESEERNSLFPMGSCLLGSCLSGDILFSLSWEVVLGVRNGFLAFNSWASAANLP